MDERNELNDIILNKSSKTNNTKKILLTIATFAIVLIIVVVVMNQVGGSKESSLPHAPQKHEALVEEVVLEPEVETQEESIPVIENSIEHTSELVDKADDDDKEIVVPDGKDETERIVDAVFEEEIPVKEPVYSSVKESKPAKRVVKKEPKRQVIKPAKIQPSGKYDPKSEHVKNTSAPVTAVSGKYYIQVGSFAKYKPSKSFLNKIANHGYTYTFHKVTRSGKTLNKVLVGPFRTQSAAREALPVIKRDVERGAFLTKI